MLGFNDILGHEQIKEHFRNAVETGKVSHAYILSGEAGMGRKSLANAFALSLLCEKGMAEPCMQCHACKQVLSGNHPDLIYVTHEKPASIGVDDIREQLNDTIQVRPYSSYYKIYIVDEAEKMTVQAQNALLKTIEEPPAYAVILLLPRIWRVSAETSEPPVPLRPRPSLHWLTTGKMGWLHGWNGWAQRRRTSAAMRRLSAGKWTTCLLPAPSTWSPWVFTA